MDDPREHQLVIKALTSGLSNCVEWKSNRTIRIILEDSDLQGLTHIAIKRLLIAHVRSGGVVTQHVEDRPEHRDDFDYWYKSIIPVEGFPHGVFVEMVLADDDPDYPVVLLVSAHRQRR